MASDSDHIPISATYLQARATIVKALADGRHDEIEHALTRILIEEGLTPHRARMKARTLVDELRYPEPPPF